MATVKATILLPIKDNDERNLLAEIHLHFLKKALCQLTS